MFGCLFAFFFFFFLEKRGSSFNLLFLRSIMYKTEVSTALCRAKPAVQSAWPSSLDTPRTLSRGLAEAQFANLQE